MCNRFLTFCRTVLEFFYRYPWGTHRSIELKVSITTFYFNENSLNCIAHLITRPRIIFQTFQTPRLSHAHTSVCSDTSTLICATSEIFELKSFHGLNRRAHEHVFSPSDLYCPEGNHDSEELHISKSCGVSIPILWVSSPKRQTQN